jgi:hypothetical protein
MTVRRVKSETARSNGKGQFMNGLDPKKAPP